MSSELPGRVQQLHVLVGFVSKEQAFTLSYRPPELCMPFTDLREVLDELCDAWAAGFTVIETAGFGRFFTGESDVSIASQIQALAAEKASEIGGYQMKRLRQFFEGLHPGIRRAVDLVTHPNPRSRSTVKHALSKVRK